MALRGNEHCELPVYYDRLRDDKILASLAANGGLQSLSDRELELERELLTVDRDPKPVKAWVRFYSTPLRVDAWAIRWTSKAVEVRSPRGTSSTRRGFGR